MILWPMGQGEMDLRGGGCGWWEGGGGLRSLKEACLRAVAVLGRNNLNNIKIAAFHGSLPLSLPSGLERSERGTANNWERGVNSSHHCQWNHIWVTVPTSPAPPLLFHFPYSPFCGLYLTGGLQVGFITPPHPGELYPGGVYGSLRGCSAHQEIKVSSSSKMLLLTMTFSTLIDLTSQTHARLGLQ